MANVLTDYSDPNVPLTPTAAEIAQRSNSVLRDYAVVQRVQKLEDGTTEVTLAADGLASGPSALVQLDYTGQPTAGETLVVTLLDENDVELKVDTYEFLTDEPDATVADDGNIGVFIGATADDSYENLLLAMTGAAAAIDPDNGPFSSTGGPARRNGTIGLVVTQSTGDDYLRFWPAAAVGDAAWITPVPKITFTDGLSNATLTYTGFRATPGADAGANNDKAASFVVDVTAEHLAASQPVEIPLMFAPMGAIIQVRNTSGEEVRRDIPYELVKDPDFSYIKLYLAIPSAYAAVRVKRKEIQIPLVANSTQTVNWNPDEPINIRSYKFVRGGTVSAGTATIALDKITRSTGAVAAALSTAVDVASGTNDAEQTFTPTVAAPHVLTDLQGLAARAVLSNDYAGPASVTLIVEYLEPVQEDDLVNVRVFGRSIAA